MKNDGITWDAAYSMLSDAERLSDADEICSAITRLGKPYDPSKIQRAAPLVSTYLTHENFIVRYQAIWFLGCWGRLSEWLPALVERAQTDVEVDNRAFAARCVGQILKSEPNATAIRILLRMVVSEGENPEIRAAGYSALLYAFYGESAKSRARDFEPTGTKLVRDFDLGWLGSLEGWADELPGK